MATTPTKDDIPSEKPVNLKFNAGKLDEEVNSDALTYKDRFDVERLTNAGRNAAFAEAQSEREVVFNNFISNSGYQFLGDYELGPWQFSARNQFIRYDNQYWKLAATAPDDFATTGITMQSFEVDKLSLALIDGDTLRQEMAGSGGASLSGLEQGGTVQKAIKFISPLLCGGVGGDASVDNTDAVMDCISKAKQMGLFIDLRGGPWRITKTADFTGVYGVITDYSGRIVVDAENFTPLHSARYAVTFGNPDVAYSSGRSSSLVVRGLLTVICQSRTTALNGIFIKGQLMDFDSMRATGFNGSAVTLSAVWDSKFSSISAELSGNVSRYQIEIISGGDTSNCLSISRIQSEQAYQKCLYITCIRSVINTIHAERTAIISLDDGTTDMLGGITYSTVRINIGNTTINQLIHDAISSASAPDGTATVTSKTAVLLNLDYSSVGEFGLSSASISTTFGRGSIYRTIVAGDWYFGTSPTNNKLLAPSIRGVFRPYIKLSVSGGTIADLQPANNALDVNFDGIDITSLTFPSSIRGNLIFNYCNFPATFTLLTTRAPTGYASLSTVNESKMPVTFNHCEFLGVVTGADQARAVFNGGYISQVSLATRVPFEFYGVKMGSFAYTGTASFITRDCLCATVSSWATPSSVMYPEGKLTYRVGADPSSLGTIFKSGSSISVSWAKLI